MDSTSEEAAWCFIVKHEFRETEFSELNIRQRPQREKREKVKSLEKVRPDSYILRPTYKRKIVFKPAKIHDLQEMCKIRVIPKSYQPFYEE